jgi:phage FluMu protein Com
LFKFYSGDKLTSYIRKENKGKEYAK